MKFKCRICEKELDVLEVTCGECVEKEVCEWKLTDCGISEDEPYSPHVWLGEYKCEDGWYQGEKPYYKFCPNCGKRIKYVEVE